MRERIDRLTGGMAGEAWVTTFHACCARILRRDIDKLGYERAFSIYDEDDQTARRLLDEIDLTGSADVHQLAEQFGQSEQQIEQAMLRIRQLNPKPGSQYSSHDRSSYILPDVMMIKFVNEYYVALSDFSLPQIRISED